MSDSKSFKRFLKKYNLNENHFPQNGSVEFDFGVFKRSDRIRPRYFEICERSGSVGDKVLAGVHAIGSTLYELQCLLHDARRNGIDYNVDLDPEDPFDEHYYLTALSLIVPPIGDVSDLKERLLEADKLIPHRADLSYLDLVSVDGVKSLSGRNYDGPDIIEKADNLFQVFYRERGSKRLDFEFYNQQCLFEYLVDSVLFLI